jgi:hypothetical protein
MSRQEKTSGLIACAARTREAARFLVENVCFLVAGNATGNAQSPKNDLGRVLRAGGYLERVLRPAYRLAGHPARRGDVSPPYNSRRCLTSRLIAMTWT